MQRLLGVRAFEEAIVTLEHAWGLRASLACEGASAFEGKRPSVVSGCMRPGQALGAAALREMADAHLQPGLSPMLLSSVRVTLTSARRTEVVTLEALLERGMSKCIAKAAEGALPSAQLPRLLARLVSASNRSPELLDRLVAAARSVPAVLAQLLGLLSPARRLLAAQQAVESTSSATATADAADLLVAGEGSGGGALLLLLLPHPPSSCSPQPLTPQSSPPRPRPCWQPCASNWLCRCCLRWGRPLCCWGWAPVQGRRARAGGTCPGGWRPA